MAADLVVGPSSHPGARPGVNPRADNTKPTDGAGTADPGRMLDRLHPSVAIVAPSVGLPLFSPVALAPGTPPTGGHRITRVGALRCPSRLQPALVVSPGVTARARADTHTYSRTNLAPETQPAPTGSRHLVPIG